MPLFAVVYDNEVKEIREYASAPECKIRNGLPVIRPFVEAEENDDYVRGGFIIHNDRVERVLVDRPQNDKLQRLEEKTTKLFFKLVKYLEKKGVIDNLDPDADALLKQLNKWKQLGGN